MTTFQKSNVMWGRALIAGTWRVVPAHGEQWKVADMRRLVGPGYSGMQRAQDEAINANAFRAAHPTKGERGMVIPEMRTDVALRNTHRGTASVVQPKENGPMEAVTDSVKRRGVDWNAEGGKPTYIRFPRNTHYLLRAYAKANRITIERALLTLCRSGFDQLPGPVQDELSVTASRMRGDA